MSATILEKYGLKDLPQRIADLWIENAASALEKNTSTFAVLPIAQLLDPHGWTERLRANGYVVEEPN
jgi:hypothetical protein